MDKVYIVKTYDDIDDGKNLIATCIIDELDYLSMREEKLKWL